MPHKISSIIIAKNEAENIGRCIESQLNCIDEIILIVDSQTTDNTAEIAGKFENVKIEITDWKGYSATKQFAVEKATNQWIFWIDADEEVTPELCDELNEWKKSGEEKFSAYKVARRAFFLGRWIKHSGWYPGRVTRLFNKHKARFNDNQVHEGLQVEGAIANLKNDLNHYTDPDIEHYYEKFNRYTSLAAEEMFKAGKTSALSDLIIRPLFLFFKMYILKKGFLDGKEGFMLAVFSSNYVFTKYAKLTEMNKTRKK